MKIEVTIHHSQFGGYYDEKHIVEVGKEPKVIASFKGGKKKEQNK